MVSGRIVYDSIKSVQVTVETSKKETKSGRNVAKSDCVLRE